MLSVVLVSHVGHLTLRIGGWCNGGRAKGPIVAPDGAGALALRHRCVRGAFARRGEDRLGRGAELDGFADAAGAWPADVGLVHLGVGVHGGWIHRRHHAQYVLPTGAHSSNTLLRHLATRTATSTACHALTRRARRSVTTRMGLVPTRRSPSSIDSQAEPASKLSGRRRRRGLPRGGEAFDRRSARDSLR
jgi:hypothetical protein